MRPLKAFSAQNSFYFPNTASYAYAYFEIKISCTSPLTNKVVSHSLVHKKRLHYNIFFILTKSCFLYFMNSMNDFFSHRHTILFAKTIYLQLFVLLISFPILVYWGISISPLCLLSTPFFTPLLTLFLFASSLFFVCLLFNISPLFFAFVLEKSAACWAFFFEWKHTIPAFGFSTTLFPLLLLCPLFAIYIAMSKKSLYKKIAFLFLAFGTCVVIIKEFDRYQNAHFFIPCHTKKISLYIKNGTLIVFDPGVIGARPSARSWATFELLPAITTHTGATHIDHFIMGTINQRSLEAVNTLLEKNSISFLYLPFFEGSLKKRCWHAYFQLNTMAKSKNCTIVKITPNKCFSLANTGYTVQASKKRCHYQNIFFNPLVLAE